MDNSCKHSDRKKPVQKSIYCMIPFLKVKTKTLISVSLKDGVLTGKGYKEVSEGTDNVLFLDPGTC